MTKLDDIGFEQKIAKIAEKNGIELKQPSKGNNNEIEEIKNVEEQKVEDDSYSKRKTDFIEKVQINHEKAIKENEQRNKDNIDKKQIIIKEK